MEPCSLDDVMVTSYLAHPTFKDSEGESLRNVIVSEGNSLPEFTQS